MKTIYLAAGCFWGSQAFYDRMTGVVSTEVGYANGNSANPRYEDLKHGQATHAETVKITYDEHLISLEKLLDYYMIIVDPYSVNRQGEDVGIQYRTGIFYDDD
jgi:methionine-S-sulfoxide reductase